MKSVLCSALRRWSHIWSCLFSCEQLYTRLRTAPVRVKDCGLMKPTEPHYLQKVEMHHLRGHQTSDPINPAALPRNSFHKYSTKPTHPPIQNLGIDFGRLRSVILLTPCLKRQCHLSLPEPRSLMSV